MSERQERPEERASGGTTGQEALRGMAEQGVSGGMGGSEAASGGAVQVTGSGGLGQQNVGQAGPDTVQGALQTEQELRDRGQELRDRGREMREIGRERARELRELARRATRSSRGNRHGSCGNWREPERAMARGLRGPGRGRTGAGMAGAGTAGAGTAGAGMAGAGMAGAGMAGAGMAGAGTAGTAGGTWGGWRAGATGTGSAGTSGGDGRATGDERSTPGSDTGCGPRYFHRGGLRQSSLREIAERMGFTKAALYYHFPSKADMLMALHLRMHNIIDEPISLLGDGPVSVEMWEKFLDACINTLKGNQKLFEMHRINQAAMARAHSEGHEGAHQELEEQAMRISPSPP